MIKTRETTQMIELVMQRAWHMHDREKWAINDVF